MTTQLDFFDLLNTSEKVLCSSWVSATKNEFGVFKHNTHVYEFRKRKDWKGCPEVELKLALLYPYVYIGSSMQSNVAGYGSPCAEDDDDKFSVFDSISSVRKMLTDHLMEHHPERFDVKESWIENVVEQALKDLEN